MKVVFAGEGIKNLGFGQLNKVRQSRGRVNSHLNRVNSDRLKIDSLRRSQVRLLLLALSK